MTNITDAVTVGGMQITDEGYLVANARTARTGIQAYLGAEMGRPDLQTVNVWRDEGEVFRKSSLDTFSRVPITMDHPTGGVDADNWRDLAVGTTGDEVLRDGEFLKIGLKITDAAAVKAVRDGRRELSVGYSAEIEWVDGIAPDGTPYQARQTNIKANHIAIVDRGRAGPMARIGDHDDAGKDRAKWGLAPITVSDKKEDCMSDALKTVVLGDKAAQVAAADAQIIENYKAEQAKAMADAKADHDKAIAAKDAEIAKKDAEIEKLTKSQLSDADLQAKVEARAKLVSDAKSIHADLDPKGMSDADIRKATVTAKLGADVIDGKSDEYIAARFDILADEAAKGDVFADLQKGGIKSQPSGGRTVADDAYAKNLTDLSTAWMGNAKQEA